MTITSEKDILTSRDIARMSGVSQSTVSRVLSGHPNVSAKTRAAVTEILNQTGFVPNASARAMRTQRSRSIGVVVSTPVNLYGLEVMGQVHEHVARHGLRLSVWLADVDGNAPDALQALRERSVDGLIYTAAVDHMPELEADINAGAPIVLMGRTVRGVATDTVAGANAQGGRRVADYLIQHGRRDIAWVGGRAFSPGREIEQGFRNRLASLGAPIDESRVVYGDLFYASGEAAVEQLWNSKSKPDTIFCANDLVAYGVLDAARKSNIRVPEDLWVIGYNNIPISGWAAYDLTTVYQPIADMARVSVELLLQRIEGKQGPSPQRRRLEGKLIVRGSTAHAPHESS
ncbi:LacI family DNA-binding transcriptional regulator [Pseudarthrobacter siccitolerans]|uniref:LacI family DNA-binding transcriptional regulator n=1 Tax=Pseudarthrobacter siccitolerans TaxID=861266 RepID=UPI0009F8561B|nr:LacI family DNA-binding transcriptional regulator [Pseudarthrobacter siccitolerans]